MTTSSRQSCSKSGGSFLQQRQQLRGWNSIFRDGLRFLEISNGDKPEDLDPNLVKVGEIAKGENEPDFAQNHFLSVSPLKPGLFRKFTLGIALWGIELVVSRAFRPGFIVNMGTIHFARWFRPPGSERLVFLSNYDGRWESYLEDFITEAYPGQNAAWSNAVGFLRRNG